MTNQLDDNAERLSGNSPNESAAFQSSADLDSPMGVIFKMSQRRPSDEPASAALIGSRAYSKIVLISNRVSRSTLEHHQTPTVTPSHVRLQLRETLRRDLVDDQGHRTTCLGTTEMVGQPASQQIVSIIRFPGFCGLEHPTVR